MTNPEYDENRPPPPPRGTASAQHAPPPPPPIQYSAQGQGAAVIGRDQAVPPPPPVYAQPAPQQAPVAAPAQQTTAAWPTTVARPATQAAMAAEATGAISTISAPAQAGAAPVALPDTGRQEPPAPTGPVNGNGHTGLTGRLARLRIGSHTVSRSALAQIRVSSSGSGLILGADRHQGPVLVRFFRPSPTRITLVGGVWAGQLVAFRALALGARVAVVTTEPYAWQGFGERATGRGDRVAIMTTDQPIAVAATVHQPLLVVYDRGAVGATAPQPLGPWQTQLTILRQLDQTGVSSVQDCDLVMLQRLAGNEAALAGSALRLPAPSTQFLQVMADDMVALVGGGADRYVWLAQTDVERQYAGAPRR